MNQIQEEFGEEALAILSKLRNLFPQLVSKHERWKLFDSYDGAKVIRKYCINPTYITVSYHHESRIPLDSIDIATIEITEGTTNASKGLFLSKYIFYSHSLSYQNTRTAISDTSIYS